MSTINKQTRSDIDVVLKQFARISSLNSRNARFGVGRMLCKASMCVPRVARLRADKDFPPEPKNARPASDTFDIFIDDFIGTKSELWKRKSKDSKLLKNWNKSFSKNTLKSNMSLNQTNLLPCDNAEIFKAASCGDYKLVLRILDESLKHSNITYGVLENIALQFLECGSIKGIVMLEDFAVRELNISRPQFYEHQLRCLKQKGENTKALTLCEDLYVKYPDIRREIRGYMSHVLIDIVENHSEAALIQGKELVERLSREYNDFRPMSSLWHACFLSEWFSDQQVASHLLLFVIKQHSIKTIERRMMAATYTALAQHRSELVHNLLQDLLSCKQSSHVTSVLRALFDYKCKKPYEDRPLANSGSQGDLKGCAAILRTSLEINCSLSSEQHSRLLDLLTRRKKAGWLHRTEPLTKVKPQKPPSFQLKF